MIQIPVATLKLLVNHPAVLSLYMYMRDNNGRLLDIGKAAEYFGISRKAVYSRISRGKKLGVIEKNPRHGWNIVGKRRLYRKYPQFLGTRRLSINNFSDKKYIKTYCWTAHLINAMARYGKRNSANSEGFASYTHPLAVSYAAVIMRCSKSTASRHLTRAVNYNIFTKYRPYTIIKKLEPGFSDTDYISLKWEEENMRRNGHVDIRFENLNKAHQKGYRRQDPWDFWLSDYEDRDCYAIIREHANVYTTQLGSKKGNTTIPQAMKDNYKIMKNLSKMDRSLSKALCYSSII